MSIRKKKTRNQEHKGSAQEHRGSPQQGAQPQRAPRSDEPVTGDGPARKGAPDGGEGESPFRLMAWLWGVPIVLIIVAVVVKAM